MDNFESQDFDAVVGLLSCLCPCPAILHHHPLFCTAGIKLSMHAHSKPG